MPDIMKEAKNISSASLGSEVYIGRWQPMAEIVD
jgi:hypothetical protein